MTEIEKTEGELKILQAKLELLKEIENFKSPVEEAYQKVYGWYPPTTPSVSNYEDNRWSAFQAGYNASQEQLEQEMIKRNLKTSLQEPEQVNTFAPKELEELIRESKKWCEENPEKSVEDYLTPQGPQGPVGPGPGPKGVIVGYEPTPQEPEELKTLYQMLRDEECRDDICKVVKEWMSQYEFNGWEDDWDVGFSDCFYKLNKGLK